MKMKRQEEKKDPWKDKIMELKAAGKMLKNFLQNT
jgi:hypothetical protein